MCRLILTVSLLANHDYYRIFAIVMGKNEYEDIIHLSHPAPKLHPRMDLELRIIQLASFEALPEYGEASKETSCNHREGTRLKNASGDVTDGRKDCRKL